MNLASIQEKRIATQRVTLLGAIVNILLALVKILTGYLGHSHALLADGIHSLADLIADAAVLWAAKYGNQAADNNHPYGHQRIETVTAVFIALVLLLTGFGIIFDAIQHLQPHTKTVQNLEWNVLWIALASLVANEIVYRYTLSVAQRYHSALLKAHAWHRRSDAAASLVVCVGIVGALLGFAYLDNIAAVIMGLLILKMAYKMGRQGLEELVDQGLDNDTLAAIQNAIQQVDGVRAMHQLRTRFMAGRIFADVHIMVDAHISVSEGHYIADNVYQALKQQFTDIKDIIVHVDAEDDEMLVKSNRLPSRSQLNVLLQQAWSDLPGYAGLRQLNCHYLNQHLELDIALHLETLKSHSTSELQHLYQTRLGRNDSHLRLYFYEDCS